MTMVPKLRIHVGQMACRAHWAGRVVALSVLLAFFASAGSLAAQESNIHYPQTGDMPPGAIGRWQLLRGGPLPGYCQPVEILAPRGAKISLVIDGQFDAPRPAPRTAGMFIGNVYRLRVTNLRLHPGVEVFPTIELINRVYPPPGRELQFPVPIDLTQEELVLAAEGAMVTRVIYVEDPQQAMPTRQNAGRQNWFEAPAGEDPLRVADRLGRPIAILRMGGIVPTHGEGDEHFLFGSPPVVLFPAAAAGPAAEHRAAPPELLPPGRPSPRG